jgi:hypothetical protein
LIDISILKGRKRRLGIRRRRRPVKRRRRAKALRMFRLGGSSPPRVVQGLSLLRPAS